MTRRRPTLSEYFSSLVDTSLSTPINHAKAETSFVAVWLGGYLLRKDPHDRFETQAEAHIYALKTLTDPDVFFLPDYEKARFIGLQLMEHPEGHTVLLTDEMNTTQSNLFDGIAYVIATARTQYRAYLTR